MKNVKWSAIVVAACYIGAGCLFFVEPSLTRELICKWIGYCSIAFGIVDIISYFIRPKHESYMENAFRDGLILITLGILVLIKKTLFIELVYLILAIVIMISGYNKIQDCVVSWRLGIKNGLVYLVLASISVILGLFILSGNITDVKTLHSLIAAGLFYSGITDLISTLFLSKQMNDYINSLPKQEEKQEEETEEELAE